MTADGGMPPQFPQACERCLRRGGLLAGLAPRIEKATADRPGSRSDELLSLDDETLAAALGTTVADAGEAGAEVGGRQPALRGDDPGRGPPWSVCVHAGAYPDQLGHLGPGAPAALFGLGDPARLDRLLSEPSVTIVGSRRASAYGQSVAYELGLLLARAGITVISGLAFGIDSAAHRGALEAGGLTVAVLGGGADVPSPQGMAGLYRRIAAEGLVVSEMPPGFRPFRWSFPARNRIMAALGDATVVVEAAERSGSLITVRIAQALGRDVGAVPGPITSRYSRGANMLLRDGAFPVLAAEDVIEQLLGPGSGLPGPPRPEVDESLTQVLVAIEGGAATPDAVARTTALEPGAVATALARLELLGCVRADQAGRYVATGFDGGHEPAPA